MKKLLILIVLIIPISITAQNMKWSTDGHSYYQVEAGEINRYALPANTKTTLASKTDLTPTGQPKSLQYPEIYKTGIAVAAVANQLTYDNIYQERYMGLPQENRVDFIKGSPITHAKNLQGNLLSIDGTGDDNVHYANADMLSNELVKLQ